MEPTELETVEAQHWVELSEALERLEKNADFKKVILESYFRDVVLDHVSLLANETIKQRGQRPELMERLVAISTLQDHFKMIKNLGSISKEDLEELVGPETEN